MVNIIAQKTMAAQIPAIIVTMGGDGAVFANLEGEKGFCPARKVEVKDTTGAGDAFCAGALMGIYLGWKDEAVLEFASAAAVMALGAPDATSGLRSMEEIKSFCSAFPRQKLRE